MNFDCKRLLIFLIITNVYSNIVGGFHSDPSTHHHRWRSRIHHPFKTTTTATTTTPLPTRGYAIVTVTSKSSNGPPREIRTNLLAVPPNNDDESSAQVTSDVPGRNLWTVLVMDDPKRATVFSLFMAGSGALLGPFLDAYHSAFGVLQYDKPLRWTLWGSEMYPALTTAWWVPELFGLAGFLIGWLYILFDDVLETSRDQKSPTPPKILLGISIFTFQYWLSGILFESSIVDRTDILNLMSIISAIGFLILDGSMAGILTSLATCIGGPLIEVGLITATTSGILSGGGGYHYTDLGETGFFPLWIVPVYFLGGPANGNLARGFWNALSVPKLPSSKDGTTDPTKKKQDLDPCPLCQDTRRAVCPNCDGIGTYVAMGGRTVRCTSCNARGFVMCRACFDQYDEDPYDVDSIRDVMNRMPD